MKVYILSFLVLSAMVFSTAKAQPNAAHANDILKQAYKLAAKENKNVFLMFHASWCGWCHKMDSSMNDSLCKELFENNYIITHLDVLEHDTKKNLENPGAMDLLKKYHGDNQGIPFWLIFDKNGKLLADSQIRKEDAGLNEPGKNVGCPASKEEVAHFMEVLMKTSSLNENQLAVIAKRFSLNAN